MKAQVVPMPILPKIKLLIIKLFKKEHHKLNFRIEGIKSDLKT